jgi:hypothetical protein
VKYPMWWRVRNKKAIYIAPGRGEGGTPLFPLVTDMEGCNATDMLALPVQLRFSVALHLKRGNLSPKPSHGTEQDDSNSLL